jgi:hypothetical protein
MAGVDAKHILCVPLHNPNLCAKASKDPEGKVLAVLQLYNKHGGHAFGFVDEHILSALARHVAFTLELAWCALLARAHACVVAPLVRMSGMNACAGLRVACRASAPQPQRSRDGAAGRMSAQRRTARWQRR